MDMMGRDGKFLSLADDLIDAKNPIVLFFCFLVVMAESICIEDCEFYYVEKM